MRNMLLIARREYLEQIRGRAFRISTVLVPVILVGLLSVSAFTGHKLGAGKHIVIAADDSALAADIRSSLLDERASRYTAETIAPFTDQDRAGLLMRIQNKSIDGALIVENSTSASPQVTYISESSGDLMDTSRLKNAVNDGLLNLRLAQQGLSPDQVKNLLKAVSIETQQISGNGKTSKSQGMSPFYKAMLMTFLMTMPILLYGMDMARSIVEEKARESLR